MPIIHCDAYLFFGGKSKNQLRLHRWTILRNQDLDLYLVSNIGLSYINREKHDFKTSSIPKDNFVILKISFDLQITCHTYCKYL